ncbi:DUF3055 domain-containing protein [Paenibacillus sp. SYP-B3998]|uniref:DUF3055 domain-containing protein n=1 Tax=Paenibacillus sp. SYP-B3998 TaxID=2678564 RepID=A0A6G4A315_9BACL|nr:DUF3055 domain-containing protein [Paenibacillus sp. SYP-B3998]NEW08209.1 DUF3055 domain-containing protein [Paenibacillus sp. SYP-B3998]
MSDFDFLYDHSEETTTRFVCFIGEALHRFDLAIMTTTRYYGKKLVIDLQSGRSAVIGPDDLAEEGYLEHVFKVTEEQAQELVGFLSQVIGSIHFTDI